MARNIAIIGAGISGMSTAYLLKNNENSITIFARAFSPDITSNRAAAFWFPYHIRNDKRGINWCRTSYNFYKEMAKNAATGISMQQLIKILRKSVNVTETTWLDFMPADSYRIMSREELDDEIEIAYDVQVPLIETQIFLPYLENKLKAKGVNFFQQEIRSFDEITRAFDVVINCSALGSRQLCKDAAIIPVRGQVGLLSPRNDFPIFLDNEKPLYIVPRKDAMIIGGTYEEGIEAETTEPATIERLLNNAFEVFPELKEQEIKGSWAGLRPYRPEVRVEHEAGTNIIHNYGHGGSGFTLAFGCAQEVAEIVASIK